jgi:CRP-like cAMP-binding protein
MITGKMLKGYSFFSSLNQEFLDKVASLGQFVSIEAGGWLFQQEDKAVNLYMIYDGQISLNISFRDHIIDTMNPYMKGEIIGWSALVKPCIYTLGARAEEASRLIGFNGEKLMKLMEENGEAGFILLRNLSEVIGERLINTYIQLMSMRA